MPLQTIYAAERLHFDCITIFLPAESWGLLYRYVLGIACNCKQMPAPTSTCSILLALVAGWQFTVPSQSSRSMSFCERQLPPLLCRRPESHRAALNQPRCASSAAPDCILREKCPSQRTDQIAHKTNLENPIMFRRNSAALTLVFQGLVQPFDMLAAEHPYQGVKFCGSLLKPD